jgi:hypothetical protein
MKSCPQCGATNDYTQMVELRGSFSWPIFFTGGLLAIIFRNAGRSRKVRCNKCDAAFFISTPLSKVSLVIFWLLMSIIMVNLIILLLFFIHMIIAD